MATDNNELLRVRMLKDPVKESPTRFRQMAPLYVNKECGWNCPKCNNPIIVTPLRAGEQYFTCETCHAKHYAVVSDEEFVTFSLKKKPRPAGETPQQPAQQKPANQQPSPNADKPAQGVLLGAPPFSSDGFDSNPPPVRKEPPVDQPCMYGPQPVMYGPQPVMYSPQPQYSPQENPNGGGATVVARPPAKQAPQSAQESNGLLQWGNIFNRKKYVLRVGKNTIGREDSQAPSDVQFSDPEMSRRSVCIEVTPTGNGYEFILTVLKATNAVLVNNAPVPIGARVQLVSGSGITLGKTLINFRVK